MKTHLTSTHQLNFSAAGNHPKQQLSKTLSRRGYNLHEHGITIHTRGLQGYTPSRHHDSRKHPCPLTKWHAYRMHPVSSTMASLYGVCFGKGLTTYWTVPYLWQGQVVARNKYGGYRNKTRSTVNLGGLSLPVVVSTIQFLGSTQQGHHLVCLNIPSWIIPVTTRFQSHGHFSRDWFFLQISLDQHRHIWYMKITIVTYT